MWQADAVALADRVGELRAHHHSRHEWVPGLPTQARHLAEVTA
jgi:hypothetical protein